MANLRTAMDASFWDLDISSPHTLDGSAKLVPGGPIPLDGTKGSRMFRFQQLSILGPGFPFGLVPSYSHTPHKELGSLSLQTLFLRPVNADCLLGLVGQVRPKKMVSKIRADIDNAKAPELSIVKKFSVVKKVIKDVMDKSFYSLGWFSMLGLTDSTSLMVGTEKHGDKKRRRYKLMLYHELKEHDLTMEAAWPGLFIDHKGGYWDVPESVSLDLTSHATFSGLRYRYGIHKNRGQPRSVEGVIDQVEGVIDEVPSSLLPGICAKAAFSYEKSKDFWRRKETLKDTMIEEPDDILEETPLFIPRPPYDVRLKDPHVAVSGIVGGTAALWLRNDGIYTSREGDSSSSNRRRSRISADLFGSVCCTLQLGQFRRNFVDLTRLDARVDISSVSALAGTVLRGASVSSSDRLLSSPRLNLIFQQQVAGPIVFRVDSRIAVNSISESWRQLQDRQFEDVKYSLCYALRILESGKIVAWYSPKRKEGMVEIRMFEF